jgi:alpha-amylase/alpha-mannosidase (GH57 family)
LSSRHLIIHGHFYQPPRENPWLSTIEPQISAAPYDNWNFRINHECYATNARARLMTDGGIKKLLNNYEYLSFNFGPTLLSWLEKFDPETMATIIAADQRAAAARDGHGPALAQVYNHIIMPLAAPRDRLTQIRWGLADFERRFGRRPEGMWLAETAVDLVTLEMLAREGLKFTILAQNQAREVRLLPVLAESQTNTNWLDVSGGRVDPREPYRVFWGRGSRDYLDVFFYDGPVSRAIAFERLLSDGAALLARVEEAFGQERADGGPRLVNLATDGESYGHHFTFGEMALAWLFDHLASEAGGPEAIELTNYGQYLAKFPPVREARIFENSSWSCAHGVERWRDDCGCNTGGGGGAWNQKWRRPLRDGLNWLRDRLAETFEQIGGRHLKDPWRARDEYIKLVLNDYPPELKEDFLAAHSIRELAPQGRREVWALMETQLMSLYMFTSCGWFFDEISGLEPVQNLRYALRAIELAESLGATTDLRENFLTYMDQVQPNLLAYATGRDVWRREVESGRLFPGNSAAHWVAAVLLEAPLALSAFAELRFQPLVQAIFKDESRKIMAGAVDLTDHRLERSTRHLCLAIHDGGPHLLDLWVADRETGSEIPAWLNEETLASPAGPEDCLAELRKAGGVCYGWADLLPGARRQLVRALVNQTLAELWRQAEDFHQLTRSPKGEVAPPANWAEGFLHQAATESVFSRLLESGLEQFDFEALAELVGQGWFNTGPLQFQAELRALGETFLDQAVRDLAGGRPLRPVLAGLTSYLKIMGQPEGLEMNLWATQNRWWELAENEEFMGRLDPEEKELMLELGLALGFLGFAPKL